MNAWLYDAIRSPRTRAKPGGALHALTPQALLTALYDHLSQRKLRSLLDLGVGDRVDDVGVFDGLGVDQQADVRPARHHLGDLGQRVHHPGRGLVVHDGDGALAEVHRRGLDRVLFFPAGRPGSETGGGRGPGRTGG